MSMYDAFKYFTRAAQLVALESEAGDPEFPATTRTPGVRHPARRKGAVWSRFLDSWR